MLSLNQIIDWLIDMPTKVELVTQNKELSSALDKCVTQHKEHLENIGDLVETNRKLVEEKGVLIETLSSIRQRALRECDLILEAISDD